MTRPDISYAIHTVSQFVANSRKSHLAAIYRILRYLQETIDRGLFYSAASPFQLAAYADAD